MLSTKTMKTQLESQRAMVADERDGPHFEMNHWTPLIPSAQVGFTSHAFLPDFTEHPKPKKHPIGTTGNGGGGGGAHPPSVNDQDPSKGGVSDSASDDQESEITFFHDFVAGGVAGCASVVVGHPFDTIKVRLQSGAPSNGGGLLRTIAEFGGVHTLFRGMGAPLSAAAFINALVFGSYGFSSRFYDSYLVDPVRFAKRCENLNHDPWEKSTLCGSFAGLVQCTVICPMEHIKVRLQVQHETGGYSGPIQAARQILSQHGFRRFYQGWWSTVSREVPAFGLYFATYDYLKDRINSYLARQAGLDPQRTVRGTANNGIQNVHLHTWVASAWAGGCAGSVTWAVVYPVDVIKTKIQTSPLTTPWTALSMWTIGSSIVQQHGWRHLFRGLGIALIRAFPVNGTIFPVYEFTLQQVIVFENRNNNRS